MAKVRQAKRTRRKPTPAKFAGGTPIKFPSGLVQLDQGDVIRSPAGRRPIPGRKCWGQAVGWNCVSTAYADVQGMQWDKVYKDMRATGHTGQRWPLFVAKFDISGFEQKEAFEYARNIGFRGERFKGDLMDAVNKFEEGVLFTQYDHMKYRNFSHAIGMRDAKLILGPGEKRPGNASQIILPDGSRSMSPRRIDFVSYPTPAHNKVVFTKPRKKAAKKSARKRNGPAGRSGN